MVDTVYEILVCVPLRLLWIQEPTQLVSQGSSANMFRWFISQLVSEEIGCRLIDIAD